MTLASTVYSVIHDGSLSKCYCWQSACAMLVHADVNILTQNTMKHSFPCFTVKSCPLVNDCDLLAGFSDFYPPVSHLTPSVRWIPSSYRVHIWHGKTRIAGLQSGECHRMIESVVWARQRARHRRGKCSANELRRVEKAMASYKI